MNNKAKYDVTIAIPVFNGEKQYLEETIKAVLSQKSKYSYQLLIIDSGSTDNSLNIISKFAHFNNVELVEIKNSEFGHGKTRQFAAERSDSVFMVYLSQDATPANEHWLDNIIKPFFVSENVIAVFGNQIPRANSFPLQKFGITNHFNNQGSTCGITLYDKSDKNLFFSDVNSAVRREVLVSEIPFKDVNYGEDHFLASEIYNQNSNNLIAYSPRGGVIHSNTIKLKEYKFRIFDEYYSLRLGGKPVKPQNYFKIFKSCIRLFLFTIYDNDYNIVQKVLYLFTNPLYLLFERRGAILALKNLNEEQIKHYSLESRNISKQN